MSEYVEGGSIPSLTSPTRYAVEATTLVDATFMNVQVPAMAEPSSPVSDGTTCVPPNALASLKAEFTAYTVIRVGKTSFDACIFFARQWRRRGRYSLDQTARILALGSRIRASG